MNCDFVSVIVPVYNRASEVHMCLDALNNQTYPDGCFEIIVVDDYSTDDLKSAVKKYPKVRYVLNELEFSLPGARNMGLRLAKGDIVVFLDDDAVVEKNYLEEVVRVFKSDPKVGGVTGKQKNVSVQIIKKGVLGKLMHLYAMLFGISGFFANLKGVGKVLPTGFLIANFEDVEGLMEVEWLSGCNMTYSKKAIDEAGAFDPKYDGHSYHEDADFSHRIFKSGFKLLASSDAVVEHLVSPVGREKLSKIKYYQLIHNDRFFLKNVYEGSRNRYLRHIIAHLSLFLPILAYSVFYRNPQMIVSYFKAEEKVFWRLIKGLEE